jgi:type VII secretion protein EccE
VAGGIAFLLLLMVFGRASGRWWYETFAARWRLRRRRAVASRHIRAAYEHGETRMAPLAAAISGFAVRAVDNRGREIGIGQDEDGWFAAVRLGPWQDMSGNQLVHLGLEQLVSIVAESTVQISALQIVSHRVGAPSRLPESASAAVRSYQELVMQAGCPLEQAAWLAVRLSPPDAAEAAWGRGGGMDGVDRAIAAAIGRIEKVLASAGVPHRVLDADGLREALAAACGLEALGRPTENARPAVREQWSTWQAGGLTHVTFDVRHWPRQPNPELLAELAAVQASEVSVALVIRPYGERIAMLGLVRVVAPPAGLRPVLDQLTSTARKQGVRLGRLYGNQARGVYATAPTGGGGLQ